MAGTAREPAPPTAATRPAWALCVLSVALAVASVALALFNGENLIELVAYHHAIGILNALVLGPIGALIVVGGVVVAAPSAADRAPLARGQVGLRGGHG